MTRKNRGGLNQSVEDSELTAAVRKLTKVIDDIKRIRTSFEDDTSDANKSEVRLEILNRYIDDAFRLQTEVDYINPNVSLRADLEELCIGTKALLMPRHGYQNRAESTMHESSFHHRQLPKVKLPKFSGNYLDYQNFRGVFDSLVDNDHGLTNVEKFNHLLASLEREALGTVKAFQVTDANYKKALSALDRVYNNSCLTFFDGISKLFAIPCIPTPSASALRSTMDTVTAIYESLLSIGNDKSIANAILIHIVMSKVDSETRSKWEENLDYQKIPLWKDCEAALNKRYQHLSAGESMSSQSKGIKPNYGSGQKKSGKTSLAVAHTKQIQSSKCVFCKALDHFIQSCPAFTNVPVESRFNFAKGFPLCINCLRKGHSVSTCKSRHCKICSKPHHTVLHRYSISSEASNDQVQQTVAQQVLSVSSKQPDGVVLATAVVKIKDQLGQYQLARALLDSGSQVNFITDELARNLKLKRTRKEVSLLGIGKSTLSAHQEVEASIASRFNSFSMDADFVVLKSISSYQPERIVSTVEWDLPNNLELADPAFSRPQKIDLLIGADAFFELLKEGRIRQTQNSPTLQNTMFGWIVSGRYKTNHHSKPQTCAVTCITQDSSSLDTIVRKFWELEKVPNPATQIYTTEQNFCESSFVKNVKQLPSGRFSVSLPFKSHPSVLGASFDTAKRRFLSLERRMDKLSDIRPMYIAFIKEYIELGHMTATDNLIPKGPHYFIPYQCVLRPDSVTTKLRVVFDASSKTSSQTSLNDILMVGATIQPSLYATLMRFRLRLYAVTADITKMYRQVEVNEDQRDFQLIVWREHSTDPLKIYRLNTVTYGTAAAPFLAVRCLKHLSDLHSQSHPRASASIANDFYVDDLLSGADTIEELRTLCHDLIEILGSSGLVLAKWASNFQLNENQQHNSPVLLGDNEDTKTLGLTWSPTSDVFKYSTKNLNQKFIPTKRNILAFTSRLFDPLGLLCPIVTRAKILIQDIWLLKLDWDDPIPDHILRDLDSVLSCFAHIESVSVPRHVGTTKESSCQVHGFADASTRAYGCCLYVRCESPHSTSVRLLTAKSRVAPLKTKTVPRLELCAAHLLAFLWTEVSKILDVQIESVTMWSDSEVVLHWLQMHPSKLATFVAHRVADIQEATLNIPWRHVPTKQNPADLVSRGCSIAELRESFWFQGPDFLYKDRSQWPTNEHIRLTDDQTMLEKRKVAHVVIAADSELNPIIKLIDDSSSYLRIVRTVAYMLRFTRRKKIAQFTSLVPSSSELGSAFLTIVQIIQRNLLSDEYKRLKESVDLKPLYQKLNPFISKETNDNYTTSLIRVGGRLMHAPLAHNAKFSLLMPKNCRFVTLFLEYLHRTNHHAGPRALVAFLRQSIWLVDARRACNSVVRRCVHCFRYKPKLMSQIMGNLPADRLQGHKPFEISGVDLFGPINVSLGIRGKPPIKTYIAVFICFASKAVHLELIKDLSANTFILCLSRFVGRRGPVRKIYCDNATNFVGAARMLKEFMDQLQANSDTLQAYAAAHQFQFVFIPPRAPHFGGLWEAAVKSAKHLLLRAVGNALLREDELHTVLVEVEAVLNSRPIVADCSNPNDGAAITPAHLLIGTTLAALSPTSGELTQDAKLSYLKRWHLVSAIKLRFWKDSSRDFVLSLQQRSKWRETSQCLQPGAVVIIHDDNIPPQHWILGVVTTTFVGSDGKVRVAEVRTKNGVYKRAIHKLAPLPTDVN